MGYGSRALSLLSDYYEGKCPSLSEGEGDGDRSGVVNVALDDDDDDDGGLLMEMVVPRAKMPPLLMKLTERSPERLDYLGVAYGMTAQLFKYAVFSCHDDYFCGWGKRGRCGLIAMVVIHTPTLSLPPLSPPLSLPSLPPPLSLHLSPSTSSLALSHRFWKKAGYLPVYLRQTEVCRVQIKRGVVVILLLLQFVDHTHAQSPNTSHICCDLSL